MNNEDIFKLLDSNSDVIIEADFRYGSEDESSRRFFKLGK
jgi:hypothetical protein